VTRVGLVGMVGWYVEEGCLGEAEGVHGGWKRGYKKERLQEVVGTFFCTRNLKYEVGALVNVQKKVPTIETVHTILS
jgi:hypothetical protein